MKILVERLRIGQYLIQAINIGKQYIGQFNIDDDFSKLAELSIAKILRNSCGFSNLFENEVNAMIVAVMLNWSKKHSCSISNCNDYPLVITRELTKAEQSNLIKTVRDVICRQYGSEFAVFFRPSIYARDSITKIFHKSVINLFLGSLKFPDELKELLVTRFNKLLYEISTVNKHVEIIKKFDSFSRVNDGLFRSQASVKIKNSQVMLNLDIQHDQFFFLTAEAADLDSARFSIASYCCTRSNSFVKLMNKLIKACSKKNN